WLSVEGRTEIKGIIEKRVQQWSRPRDFQVDAWAHSLARKHVSVVAATGFGKTSAFFGPLIVMKDLLESPQPHLPTPPKHPIAVIVTPLIELGNSHV
ncbi:hypothetical protein BKA70DRAFT_1044855, partial [Coprinopsis sp. MPI-PUGE-AT-0042]